MVFASLRVLDGVSVCAPVYDDRFRLLPRVWLVGRFCSNRLASMLKVVGIENIAICCYVQARGRHTFTFGVFVF